MSQLEALTITALGMAVVFIGLVACIAFIRLFGRIAGRVQWGEGGHGHAAAPAAEPAPAPAAELPPGEPIPADVLAVLATVLEVERKLYLNRPGSRVTLRRPALPR
ncbi:MAG: OadG family protein [Thermoanaerobaculia bacterium]|jgi:Na+-transporting methylmalonyl-CoA/oxaloacetate decarboxylase gamma subunit|nr:OadG family protein [Thermoanaerobaculia bacterium]